MSNILSERLKKERLRLKLSLQELSKLSNISKSALQRYETDSSKMKTTTIMKLAEVFNINPGYLMGWESRDLPANYLGSIENVIEESGFKIDYVCNEDSFVLINVAQNETTRVTPDEIRKIKEDSLSYLKFKLQELWSKKHQR